MNNLTHVSESDPESGPKGVQERMRHISLTNPCHCPSCKQD